MSRSIGERILRAQVNQLETMIKKYAEHVVGIEGVSYLENRYRGMFGSKDTFTDREWMDIRRIAEETE